MLFEELNLKSSSLDAVKFMGFKTPSEIQEKSIPILLDRDIDFIGQAQTGTGKTAAFTLPLLEKIDLDSRYIQAMVIAPTRELANQICVEIEKLSKYEPVRTLAVYGGVPISGQLRKLRQDKPQIIVGTPGRLIDVMGRGAFDLKKCRYVILDEADEMLDMGFFDDVQEILAQVPEKKIWMFSATMPKPILNLINKHFCDPELVKITKKILTSDSIDQQFCVVSRRDMVEALCRYLDYKQNVYAIVFTRTKVGAKELTDELNMRGFPSDALHGDMSQEQRDLTMKKFKEKKINLLVCTDVAARGIDVNDLTHVINFSLPQDNEAYVHRIGRTGRGGSKGVALSIIEPSEMRRVSVIEKITKAKIEKISLPKVGEIVDVLMEKSKLEFDNSVENFSEEDEQYGNFLAEYESKTKEDLIKGIYSLMFSQSLKRYKNAVDLDFKGRDKTKDSSNGAQAGYQRFHLNLGKDKLNTADLIRLVSRKASIKGSDIGKISIMRDFAFFEVPIALEDKVLVMNGTDWKGNSISLEVAKASRSGGGRSRVGRGRRNGNRGGNFSSKRRRSSDDSKQKVFRRRS